ncbi:hypothetical protein NDU88_003649 [Pleurodeles waltl]|uniref:Uncharacterized protein n=1 Tax=Pleurodeles waltl TaxID=8319 RepID=A0AAV7MR74_PLEWA|nr:hypothetical protein NDU88_003649 [Pleurodeles waltl]
MLSLALELYAPVAKCWPLNARLLTYKDILKEIEVTISHYLQENDTPEDLLRTKQRYYTGGDRAGRLLAQRLWVQVAGWRVAKLQLLDGTRTCREEQIVTQFKQFYSDLYAEEGLDEEGVEGYLTSSPVLDLPDCQ